MHKLWFGPANGKDQPENSVTKPTSECPEGAESPDEFTHAEMLLRAAYLSKCGKFDTLSAHACVDEAAKAFASAMGLAGTPSPSPQAR